MCSDSNEKKQSKAETPEWARGIVWYQIFPERFRNGDPNHPVHARHQENAWPHDAHSPLQRHPWTADWYAQQPWERRIGKEIWFHLQRRRYAGDLLGIIDQLDYLQDLGIGALYLNPVFYAPSHHKYDAVCYHHVDPDFGPDPQADRKQIQSEVFHRPDTWGWTEADLLLLELVEQVHSRGMYLILDGVFNHMGLNSWVYRDIKLHQKDSMFHDWMEVLSWEEESGPDGNSTPFRVSTWEGYRELPQLKQDRNGIVEGPATHIFEITRRWMDPYANGDPGAGIDGWRLDVAARIRHPFWKSWRRHVKSINPQAYLVAELIDSNEQLLPYLQGDEFDASMNYEFQFACDDFFCWTSHRNKASQFARRMDELHRAFPEPVVQVMQNLVGSHDTDRLASRLVNRDLGGGLHWKEYFERSRVENGKYDTRKPLEFERKIQRMIVLVQMIMPGAPMIYYGDEAGMWGGNDPCCRKPMLWHDYEYENETTLPDGTPRTVADVVGFDPDLHHYYRTLIRLRNSCPAIRHGNLEIISVDDARSLCLFRRTLGEQQVYLLIHNAPGVVEVDIPGYDKRLVDIHMSSDTDTIGEGQWPAGGPEPGDGIEGQWPADSPEPGDDALDRSGNQQIGSRERVECGPYTAMVIGWSDASGKDREHSKSRVTSTDRETARALKESSDIDRPGNSESPQRVE